MEPKLAKVVYVSYFMVRNILRTIRLQNETKAEKWATTHSGTRTHDLLIAGQVLYH